MGIGRRRRVAGAFLLGIVLTLSALGCGREGGSATTEVAELPNCGPPPSPAPDPAPEGAVLPPLTRVTAVQSSQPPVVQLNAYVSMSPDKIRDFVQAQPGATVEQSAGDSQERELLLTTDSHRVYLKTHAICSTASRLVEVIAPVGSDAKIPSVTGS